MVVLLSMVACVFALAKVAHIIDKLHFFRYLSGIVCRFHDRVSKRGEKKHRQAGQLLSRSDSFTEEVFGKGVFDIH